MLVVFGAGGRTGERAVRTAVNQGLRVRAAVRDPSKYAAKLGGEGVELVACDTTNDESVAKALEGAKYVIYAASGDPVDVVDNKAVGTTAKLAKAAGVEVYVLVSSMLVDPVNGWHPIRMFLNRVVKWGVMDAKYAGELALRAVGIPYVIVRPGSLTDGPGNRFLAFGQNPNDHILDAVANRSVSREDVARVCVRCILLGTPRNATLAVAEHADQSSRDVAVEQFLDDKIKSLRADEN